MKKLLIPKKKIPVGVLGATGMVGQNYVRLLSEHPWFKVMHLAASPQSAGKKYTEALNGRWQFSQDIPERIKKMVVSDVADVSLAKRRCRLVFSAVELGSKEALQELEKKYASAGLAVVSNASAHRGTANVPVLIPEINPEHLSILPEQQKFYGWNKGFIVAKPNCSLQSYLLPLYALIRAGFDIKKVMVTTLQAVSGAGYPGVPSLDMIDNVVPFIGGEEAKTESEPLKILGVVKNGKIVNAFAPVISAQCMRVPVRDGHLACVSVLFGTKKPALNQILKIWNSFRGQPQRLKLPSAPPLPIVYRTEENRPQPVKDRDVGKGMSTVVGRLRPCPVFDIKFVGLSHNTLRGAAGGGVLNAELLVAKGLVK